MEGRAAPARAQRAAARRRNSSERTQAELMYWPEKLPSWNRPWTREERSVEPVSATEPSGCTGPVTTMLRYLSTT